MVEETKPEPEKTPPTGGASQDKDIQENKGMAALSYLGILCLIPLLAKKDSPFAQFHAKQGLVILIIEVIGGFIFWLPVIGWIIWLAIIVVDIIGLIKALSGKYWKVPGIGELAQKINI